MTLLRFFAGQAHEELAFGSFAEQRVHVPGNDLASRRAVRLLCGSRVGKLSADLVNYFLPDLVFQDVGIACSTKRSRVQNLDLLLQETGKFSPQLFDATVFHGASLGRSGTLGG